MTKRAASRVCLCALSILAIFATPARGQDANPPAPGHKKIAILLQGRPKNPKEEDDPSFDLNDMQANVAQMDKALEHRGYTVYVTTSWEQNLSGQQPPYQDDSFTTLISNFSTGANKLGPDDEVFVYITGHGKQSEDSEHAKLNEVDQDDLTDYAGVAVDPKHFPAHSFYGVMEIGGTGSGRAGISAVTSTMLKRMLKKLPSENIGVVIDTCYAGMNIVPLQQIPGVVSIYTASAAWEPAYFGRVGTEEVPITLSDGKTADPMPRTKGQMGSAYTGAFVQGLSKAPPDTPIADLLTAGNSYAKDHDPTAVAGARDTVSQTAPLNPHARDNNWKKYHRYRTHPQGYSRPHYAVVLPAPGANNPGGGASKPGAGANNPAPPNSPVPPAPLSPRAKAQKELDDAQAAYDTARQKFDDATKKSEETATAMSSAGAKLETAKAANPQGGPDVNAAQAALNAAKADDDAASAAVQTAKTGVDEKKAALDNAQSALNATPADPPNGGGEGGAMRSQEPGETEATPVSLAGSNSPTSGFGPSVAYAPPALPVYDQPLCPEPGYIWTPGYWDYADRDYYWVPGTWVEAPQVGFLWTPGYWAWGGSAFFFHEGYWGPHVGFYGGINYGFGYDGHGYEGGRWEGNHFFNNTSVNRIDNTTIHNTYNAAVENTTTVNRVSYNGGNGGINARPSAQEETYEKERHTGLVAAQNQHIREARTNPELRASTNQGKPPIAATAKPGDFKSGAVPAREAGAPYKATEAIATGNKARPGNNTEADANTYNHAAEVQPHKYTTTSSGNASSDQKYQQQQDELAARQNQEHQELQLQQEKEHQQVTNKNASDTQKQQLEQRHSQQTQQLEQKHAAQQQKMRTHQNAPQSHPPAKNH